MRRLTRIRLDGNRLSVVIDHLFERQKNLRFIGTCAVCHASPCVELINLIRLPVVADGISTSRFVT